MAVTQFMKTSLLILLAFITIKLGYESWREGQKFQTFGKVQTR